MYEPQTPSKLKSHAAWAVVTLLVAALDCTGQVAERPASGPTDPREFQTFLDEFLNARMKESHIPGVAFVLVKDGEIFFTKGYGYADLAHRKPVDPGRTLFRVASVSKLFTATAVMQLVEQGALNLRQDVNRYLGRLKLEETFSRPVTLADLLTHTAGFDERFIGMAARTEDEAKPLGEYLAARMPPRVLLPGELISYSNHGIGLAGHLVEQVSGESFAQYVDENIFRPLRMRRTSFLLPPHLADDLATGYEYRQGAYHPLPFDYLYQLAPAGSLNATANDIARFMIAHLQLGRYEGTRILQEATARDMHRQHFTQHSRLPGFAYGFYEHYENHQRALVHGGSWYGFASLLFLLPEQNVGFFVACNRQQPRLAHELAARFLDRYYPPHEKTPPPQPFPRFQAGAGRFAGGYRSTRYARRTVEKLGTLLEQFRVAADGQGRLTLHYPGDFPPPSQWVQVEPLLFQRTDREAYLAFREDDKGRVTHMFVQVFQTPLALEKLLWYERAEFEFGLICFMCFFFLSAAVAWPARSLIYWGRKTGWEARRGARLARLLAGFLSALNLVVFVVACLALQNVPGMRLVYGVPRWMFAVFAIPFLTAPLAAAVLAFAGLAWRKRYWSIWGRVHYSLVTLAALLYVPFMLYWNMLGFRF